MVLGEQLHLRVAGAAVPAKSPARIAPQFKGLAA
jgi:hypothetical protein